ncbi:MAG: hypothetical protein GAK34_03960 [Delftia tsuruhatensis]|nr:MAG: hypothetical protein GAK34_03960 [Delftia tsuruhatensis]
MHSVKGVARKSCLGLAVIAALGPAQAAELLANGSFEQNSGPGSLVFTGWQSVSQAGSKGGFAAQQGTRGSITPVAVPAPPDGAFALMSDQPGPGSHVLYQDVAIPAGRPATLSARVHVQNAAKVAAAPATLDYTVAAPNQQVRIDVMNPAAAPDSLGAGVLANVFQWPPATAPGPSASGSGYQSLQFDLSAYAGQTVRLRIAEVDNRQSLFFGVDALSVWSGSVPPALGAPADAGYFAQGGSVQLTFTPVSSIPGKTVTGYEAQCVPQGGGAVLMATSSNPTVTVTGLTPGVAYNCSVAAQTSSGQGPSSQPTAVTAPISGATISTLQGGMATLSVADPASGCSLQSASLVRAQSLPAAPPQGAAAYPLGVLNLRSSGCNAGATLKLSVTMPQALPAGAQYWKYGPTAANPTPHWYAFNDGFKVTSANTYTLEVQDGGLGDDDLTANGVVVDPGGLMVMAVTSPAAIPVWNLAGLAATSASVLLAMAALRRRRRPR